MHPLVSRLHAAASVLFKSGAPFPFNKIMPYDATGGEKLYRAFEQSTWVMRAIKKIAGPMAAVDLRFSKNGERWHDPAVEAFWNSPVAGLTRSDLIEATVGWLKLEGEAFWILDDSWLVPFLNQEPRRHRDTEKIKDGASECLSTSVANSKSAINESRTSSNPQLLLARPDRMRHVVKNGVLLGWEYTDAGGNAIALLPEQVIQLKFWNPYNDWRGLAELKPCRDAAEADYLAGKFNLNLMRNNGDQGVYVIAKDEIPQDAQRQQIIDQIREKRELAQRGVFKPCFLNGDITIEDPKVRVPDADFVAARLQNRHEIFIAMGVPPSMADVKASYSIGSASDWFMLIAETCIPLGEKICQAISQVARRQTGYDVTASFDWDEHPVIQAVRRERADTAQKYFQMGVPLQALNDYLDLELPECPGWEKAYVSSKLQPVRDEKSSVADLPSEPSDVTALGIDNCKLRIGHLLFDSANDPVARMRKALEDARLRRTDETHGTNGTDAMRQPFIKAFASRLTRELMKARIQTMRALEANQEPVFDVAAFAVALPSALQPIWADAFRAVAQTSESAVSQVSRPAGATNCRQAADLEVGNTAGLETCATQKRQTVWRTEAEEIGCKIEKAVRLAPAGGRADAARAKFNEIARYRVPAFATREIAAAFDGIGQLPVDKKDGGARPRRRYAGEGGSPLRRLIHPEVRIVDAQRGIVDYVASDESIDSFKEVIRASGWRFTNFAKNAPFVDSHDYSTIGKCLGKVIDFRVEGPRLIERVQWAIDVPENKLAQIGWKMTQAGYLKAVSVGFFPVKYLTPSSGEEWTRALRELGLPGDAAVRTIYTEQEQVELSCCVIGANPNALAKAYQAGAINDADIQTLSLEFATREHDGAADSPALAASSTGQARARFLEEFRKLVETKKIPSTSARDSVGETPTGATGTVALPGSGSAIKKIMKTLSEEQFQETVLRGVNAVEEKFQTVERNQETLLRNYDQLGRETKQTMEELTRLKNTANDSTQILGAVRRLQSQLRTEAVAAGIDPIQRIINDPEKKARLNLAVRLAVDRNGDLRQACEPLARAIGEDTGEGATLIIAQLFKEIYDTLAQYGDWSALGVRRLGTKVTNFPVKTARVVAQWITTEAATIADDTNEAGSTMSLTVLPNAVLLNVSRQLIEDAEFDVTSVVMEDFQQAWNLRLDTAAFIGTGAGDANNGGFTGLFNAGNKAVAAQGNTSVAALDFDDVLRVLTTVAPIVLKRRPRWWIHPQMLVRMMGIKDNNGRPIFLGALEAPSYGAIGTILGYPVIPVMAAPNTDGAGQLIAAFGDRSGQVVGVRDDFVFEASDHYRWNTLERSFRAYGRAATGCRQANAFAVLQTASR